MARRIGLLGGTFDPPHHGHLVVAESARVDLGLDEVRLLVAADPWMKSADADAHDRAELADLAVADSDGLCVDVRELQRTGPTYTIDTLEQLRDEEPSTSWFFLVGADAVATFGNWHRAAELTGLAVFVVVDRPGTTATDVPSAFMHLEVPRVDISSSQMRERYRSGRATRHLVPPKVDDRIRAKGLYGVRDG